MATISSTKFNRSRNPLAAHLTPRHKHTHPPLDHPTRAPPPLPYTNELKKDAPFRREDWYHSLEPNSLDPITFDNYNEENVKKVIKEAQENIRDTYLDYHKTGGGELEYGEHVKASPRGQELDWDNMDEGRDLLLHIRHSDTASLPSSP